MALLTLKDIGKIYVSDGNIAVGIRGVNLSFNRGEFVAVTGKSGSGKSTLLNVISGMDSYEEGELYIDGQPTSHYLQPEWEEYREKYISFIFQDYNIIESFTVLQNVELALMHIEDEKERRHRALELIDRVGLSSHVKHKGSKLSGGQKQRTVIARALAKDSPIILADEPTGNLDSTTSREIIDLLREVSRDKLLIVVTHNFEEVERCATRHIRVFDGAIESDHVLSRSTVASGDEKQVRQRTKREQIKYDLKNGATLGKTIFAAKPKLSLFLCFLMLIGTMGIFLVTSLCGDAMDIFAPNYMFNHIDGRLILTSRNGEVMSEDEVKQIAGEYGAKSYLRYDVLLDEGIYVWADIPTEGLYDYDYEMVNFHITFNESFGDDIIGRYPTAPNEVFLNLPISYKPLLGKDSLRVDEMFMNNLHLKITGVKYYYDNNITPKCMFTREGFDTATAMYYLYTMASNNITVNITNKNGSTEQIYLDTVRASFDMDEDKVYISSKEYDKYRNNKEEDGYSTSVNFTATYYEYNYDYYHSEEITNFSRNFTAADLTNTDPGVKSMDGDYGVSSLIVSEEMLRDIAGDVLDKSYKQVSLFFEDDDAAHAAAERLNEGRYIAVTSDTTYTPGATEAMISMVICIMTACAWLLSIVFLAFFINLCSGRTLDAFKGEMAIMRSMGIGVKIIRIGMYVRMLISLIPAFIVVIATAILIFTLPQFNSYFVYLYAWQYVLIFVGMIVLTVRTTHKQIRRLFGESVKKSLRGGAAE